MLVKCIKESPYDNILIIGNTYEVFDNKDDGYTISARYGEYYIKEIDRFREKFCFISISDIREQKLNKLGI